MSEPSWTTALSEAKSTTRHLNQALASMERLARELAELADTSETTARLELAHALTDGADGGVLALLSAQSGDAATNPDARRSASILLDRLTSTLGLEPIGERGEFLRLRPEDLAEFDVRGSSAPLGSVPGLYCLARAGWSLGPHTVARPLVEAVSA